MFTTQVIKGGGKNYSVLIKGRIVLDMAPEVIIDLEKIDPKVTDWRGIRLDSALWLIEEKMGLRLWWDKGEDLILPAESRNSVRFDEGIPSPRVADGWEKKIWMSVFNFNLPPVSPAKHFMLLIDFDKQ